jgi:probable O-glycosylation ligase (exosortase A-associated)
MMLGAMMIIVPLALRNAFAAYLVWGWTAVIVVPYYMYGFMGDLRYNFFFALVTLGLLVLGKVQDKGTFTLNRTSALIIVFVLHGSMCALLAPEGVLNNVSIYIDLLKSITFCLVMFFLVNSRLRLHAMLVVIALGLGFHGFVEGMKTLVTAGGHKVTGLPGSKMTDNNHLGVAIVMALPILLYLFQYSKLRIVRYGFLGALLATALAVVGSNSRGAFLAMAAFGAVLVVTSRRKVLASVLVSFGAALVLAFSPASWFERIETIGSAGEDQSFMGRVEAWNVSTAVALKNPIFGTGFHGGQSYPVWHSIRPTDGLLSALAPPVLRESPRAAHSIYFEVLADLGFVGFFLFLALLFNAFRTAWEVRRLAKARGASMLWARDMAEALGLSCMVYAVGGAGVSLAYFEMFYVVIVLLEVLRQCVLKELKQPATVPLAGPAVAAASARLPR